MNTTDIKNDAFLQKVNTYLRATPPLSEETELDLLSDALYALPTNIKCDKLMVRGITSALRNAYHSEKRLKDMNCVQIKCTSYSNGILIVLHLLSETTTDDGHRPGICIARCETKTGEI